MVASVRFLLAWIVADFSLSCSPSRWFDELCVGLALCVTATVVRVLHDASEEGTGGDTDDKDVGSREAGGRVTEAKGSATAKGIMHAFPCVAGDLFAVSSIEEGWALLVVGGNALRNSSLRFLHSEQRRLSC